MGLATPEESRMITGLIRPQPPESGFDPHIEQRRYTGPLTRRKGVLSSAFVILAKPVTIEQAGGRAY